ncbi:Hypothetical protein LUCI_2353 [Lucifera butyrica]|uniref:Uncharacterized protein n=1 Tax=Lucifera butyrica TaxID=1351585 RepID=A0A498R7B7_9FIRM|nr:methyl-accepting chemotaxis protein [Lucifera butyrica]VBB07109.1 Hypothetical protein LUCI_2353 [Lucifera butyrica]
MKIFPLHGIGNFTLRQKLSVFFVVIAAIPLILTTIVISYLSHATMIESVYTNSEKASAGLAGDINATLAANIQLLQAMADTEEIKSMNTEKQILFMKEIGKRTSSISTFIISDANGMQTVRTQGKNTENSKRDYFVKLLHGADFSISDVQIGHSTGKASLVLAVPIRDNRQNVIGALLGVVDFEKLSQKVLDTRYGKSGYAFLVDRKGKIIVHPNQELMQKMVDVSNLAPVQAVLSGKSGAVSYETKDGEKLSGFCNVPLSGWGVVVQQPKSEAVAEATKVTLVGIGFTLLAIILAAFAGVFVATFITRPIGKLVDVTHKFAQGDLTATVDIQREDEMGQLAAAFNAMAGHLKNLIQGVIEHANQVAAASQELSASAGEAERATNQVAVTMTDFAQGSQQQMGKLEKSLQEVNEMTDISNSVAQRADNASALSEDMSKDARTGDSAVINAVEKINEIKNATGLTSSAIKTLEDRSRQISEILNVISGIAGQTNLLALNAAIEAARAGEQGRGFAVVAEEVRKLAEQSQQATEEISSIIGKIKQQTNEAVTAMDTGNVKVNEGVEVVNQVKQVLMNIMEQINNNANLISGMNTASKQQIEVMQKMLAGTQQVADIARKSSAGAETAAAATEEITASMEGIAGSANALAKTAAELQMMVSKFKI